MDPVDPACDDESIQLPPELAAAASKEPSTVAGCIEVARRLYTFLMDAKHVTDRVEDPDQNHATVPVERAVEQAVAATQASGGPPPVVYKGYTQAVSPSGIGNVSPLTKGKNVDPLFLLTAINTPLAAAIVSKAEEDDAMRLDSKVFHPKPVVPQEAIIRYRRFADETNIYIQVTNRLKEIFATYDMTYVDEHGKYIPASIYNKPIVKKAVIKFIIRSLADLFIFGYTVVAVPKDLVGWVERLTDSGVLSPVLATTGEHKVGPKAFNRLPQRTSSSILPYVHVDICQGELQQYFNSNIGDDVYMFRPMTEGLVQLEKKFRTFVVTQPHKEPRNGTIQTGLANAYAEWARFRITYSDYLHAVRLLSKPMIVVNQTKTNTNTSSMDPNAQAIIVNSLPDPTQIQQKDQRAAVIAAKHGVSKTSANIIVALESQGMTEHKSVGSLTENRVSLMQPMHQEVPGVPRITKLADISSEEQDKMEVDAFNVPRMIGEMRAECFLSAPEGMEVTNVTAPVPNQDAVILAKKFYEETIERLLNLLINPSIKSAVFDRSSSSSGSATQIEVSHAEQAKTDVTTLSIAEEFFDNVYMEHGAVLDQLGIVHVITRMRRILTEYGILEVLHEIVKQDVAKLDLNFEDLVDYMSDPAIRNQLISIGSYGSTQRKNRGSPADQTDAKSKRLMNLTLATLKNWGKVSEHARGIEAMFTVSYRSLMEGNSTNLGLRFTKKKLDTGEEEDDKEGDEKKDKGSSEEKKKKKKKSSSNSSGNSDKKKAKKKPDSSSSKDKKGSEGEAKPTIVLEVKTAK